MPKKKWKIVFREEVQSFMHCEIKTCTRMKIEIPTECCGFYFCSSHKASHDEERESNDECPMQETNVMSVLKKLRGIIELPEVEYKPIPGRLSLTNGPKQSKFFIHTHLPFTFR